MKREKPCSRRTRIALRGGGGERIFRENRISGRKHAEVDRGSLLTGLIIVPSSKGSGGGGKLARKLGNRKITYCEQE